MAPGQGIRCRNLTIPGSIRSACRDFASTRVLVTEDNPINSDLMADLLTAAGCIVNEATDGREALDMAKLERPDLMLLDIQLPVMDGIAVIREIRSDPDLESLPILR